MSGTNESSRRADGRKGEDAACVWLERNGFAVLRRNYAVRGGEIDIIAEDGQNTLFIEVKLRRSPSARPAAAVTKTKQSRIACAAARYTAEFSPAKPPRYDVIELTENGENSYLIRHIKGAFFGEPPSERRQRGSFRERYK